MLPLFMLLFFLCQKEKVTQKIEPVPLVLMAKYSPPRTGGGCKTAIPSPLLFYFPLAQQILFQADIGSVLANLLEKEFVVHPLRDIELTSISPHTQKDLGLKSLELDMVVTLELPPGEKITKRPFSSAYSAAPLASSSSGSQRKATPP